MLELIFSGDLHIAYECYSRSLALDSESLESAVVFSNRAMANLRLASNDSTNRSNEVSFDKDKLEAADDDCSRAIAIDPSYVKAWSRRGMTRYKRGLYAEVFNISNSSSSCNVWSR